MDIIELCEEFRIDYRQDGHEHCREGWIQFDCPYCSPDWGHFRLGYNLAGRYTVCWACGPHQLTETLMRLANVPYSKIKPFIDDLPRVPGLEKEARGKLTIPKGVEPMKGAHRRYLKSRGFDPDEIERLWGVQGIGQLAPRLKWRLFIPIFYHSKMVSWTTRHLRSDHNQRYWSASPQEESINHKEILYGEDYVRDTVVVCEGPTDVWRIGPGAVATLGTGFSRAQVARLAVRYVRVVVFDAEPFANARANELCDQLSVFPGKTYRVILSGKDPASSSDKEINKLRKRFLSHGTVHLQHPLH